MTIKLFCNAIIKFVLGIILVGLLLFLPAGTVQYPNGWLLMGVLFVPMFVAGIVMMFKNPQLLSKRLNAKEQQSEQSLVIKLSGLMFVVGFVLAGLDFRFGWLSFPKTVPYIAAAIFLIAYLLYAEVLRENTYLSRTIEVQENQKVIDTGLYGIVRHPMYSVTIILFLTMPLMLGSILSFVVFLFYPLIIAKRIKTKNRYLKPNLTDMQIIKRKLNTG